MLLTIVTVIQDYFMCNTRTNEERSRISNYQINMKISMNNISQLLLSCIQ